MTGGELGRIYDDEEIICREGEKGDRMYVVQAGHVKIMKKASAGENTIATLGPGEIFGEMALFDRTPRCASAVASGETRVLSIDKKKLFATISRDPTLVLRVLELMSHRVRRLNESLMQLKTEKLAMLHHVDEEEACKLVLEQAQKLIEADNGSVMLLDSEHKTLTINAAFGPEAEPKMKLSEGEGIAGDVLKTGKAELVNDVEKDERFLPGSSKIRSMLCVPLGWKGQNFGVINLSNRSERPFSIDDLKPLDTLATNASLAIQNAAVFSKLKQATERLVTHASMEHLL